MAVGEREEALVEAEREAHRLSHLVADLLVLARADAGIALKRTAVELDAVVLEAFRTARQLACGQALTLEPFEPVAVAGDEDRLTQLVLILLDNALQYTPAGAYVTLGIRREGSDAEIVIRDTGVGIAPADLPHVFERFFRADPAHCRNPGGSGLGLSIARWIVEQYGGNIMLASTPGSGTTATVRLPLLAMPSVSHSSNTSMAHSGRLSEPSATPQATLSESRYAGRTADT
jgi:two-component system, OmpR family, sensor kinase